MGHTYTKYRMGHALLKKKKLLVVAMKCKFNWMSCILTGSPTSMASLAPPEGSPRCLWPAGSGWPSPEAPRSSPGPECRRPAGSAGGMALREETPRPSVSHTPRPPHCLWDPGYRIRLQLQVGEGVWRKVGCCSWQNMRITWGSLLEKLTCPGHT